MPVANAGILTDIRPMRWRVGRNMLMGIFICSIAFRWTPVFRLGSRALVTGNGLINNRDSVMPRNQVFIAMRQRKGRQLSGSGIADHKADDSQGDCCHESGNLRGFVNKNKNQSETEPAASHSSLVTLLKTTILGLAISKNSTFHRCPLPHAGLHDAQRQRVLQRLWKSSPAAVMVTGE